MRLTEAEIEARLANPADCITFSDGNSKLAKTGIVLTDIIRANGSIGGYKPRPGANKVVSFNVPAGSYDFGGKNTVTCPGAGDCMAVCYARQGTFMFPMSKAVRILNHRALVALHREGGTEKVLDILDGKVKKLSSKVAVVRIHDSGDFFARWYLDAWVSVARRNPSILFYAYTKSVPLFVGVKLPKNMRVTFSQGGKWDDQIPATAPIARIFSDDTVRRAAGYVDGIANDGPAILGEKLIGLVYHGVRKLTGKEVSRWA